MNHLYASYTLITTWKFQLFKRFHLALDYLSYIWHITWLSRGEKAVALKFKDAVTLQVILQKI